MTPESRHGKPAEGWVKFGTQLPKSIAQEFRELTSTAGAGGSKVMTTTAVALLLALPEDQREVLCRYVVQKTWKDPDALEPAMLLSLLRHMERGDPTPNDDSPGAAWYVDRILDPEVTLPPGKKPSDRAKDTRSKGAG